jgi:hypothetical protein
MDEKSLLGGDGAASPPALPCPLRLRYVVQACARCLPLLCGGAASEVDAAPAPAKDDRAAADGGVKISVSVSTTSTTKIQSYFFEMEVYLSLCIKMMHMTALFLYS